MMYLQLGSPQFKLLGLYVSRRRHCSPLAKLSVCAALLAAAAGAQQPTAYWTIDTVAGTGEDGFSGDGGPATAAQLDNPHGVAADGAGNLYIVDSSNFRIRKVDAAGTITTIAGTGEGGFSGDGGPATAARLWASALALDEAGNIYFTANYRIRKVDAAGIITTVAGTGEGGFSGDGGPATAARLWASALALDEAGNIYFTANYRIRKVDAAGIITTVAGNGEEGFSGDGGPAVEAGLDFPGGIAVDGAGNLYISTAALAGRVIGGFLRFDSSFSRSRIRKVDAAGTITTVAGTGRYGFSGDDGPATAAQLGGASGLAVDGAGNLYIADTWNQRIRRVDAAGIIATVAGTGARGFNRNNGEPIGSFYGDGGPAVRAGLNYPRGIAVDGAGNLYIADARNGRIRKVDAAGTITTIAGPGESGFSGDGGLAVQARLGSLRGLALDEAGNLYFSGYHRIRRLTALSEDTPLIFSGGIAPATGAPVVSRISPNSIISIFGQNFAPEGAQALSPRLDDSGGVAANLATTCLEIDGKRAPLFAVFPHQINAQAPHDLMPGRARVEAIRGCGAEDEQRGPRETVEVAAVSPAFFNFPLDPEGRNPVVALHGGGPDLVGLPGAVPGVELTPAEPDEFVTLFGTGFGETEPRLEAGRIPGAAVDLASEVSFTFGGIAVPPWDVRYAGAAPCCAGLYQFTVRVPVVVPDGHIPVIATVQGVATPAGPYLTVRRRR